MNEFDPGDGWREVDVSGRENPLLVEVDGEGKWLRGWVREAPVPPLPTEPGTVIQWQDGAYLPQIAQLDPGDRHLGWWAPDDHGDPRWMTAEQLQRRIGGDKWTLLESRAVTAKAVLDRVQQAMPLGTFSRGQLNSIAREFGVES